jgi:2'-5' RNA ligase
MRPIPVPDMHITLKFLSETEDSQIPSLIDCLETIATNNALFDLELAGGILLPPQRPRTIGARIAVSEQLQKLYDDMDTTLADQGLADQDRRRFNPHITVARIDGALSAAEQEKIVNWPCTGMFFTADQIILIESTLRPQGPLYTVLTSAPLQ